MTTRDDKPSWLALGGVLALGFLLRALGYETVFIEGDHLAITVGDPYYHLRLAQYALADFPRFLTYDPYLNFPHGAYVPWPPLYDLAVAAIAGLFGGSTRALESVAAWLPPLLTSAAIVPVWSVGRCLSGRAGGLSAAALFAVMPSTILVSRVGYADHHGVQVFLGACWLALHIGLLRGDAGGRSAIPSVVGLTVIRTAMILSWSGSLAYLALAEIPLILVATGLRERRAIARNAVSLGISAVLCAPFALPAGRSIGGPFSPLEMSWLHVVACLALAGWSLCGLGLARISGELRRFSLVLASGALFLAALFAIPQVIEGLQRVSSFLLTSDFWGSRVKEGLSLYAPSGGLRYGEYHLGWLIWLLPAVPLVPLARARTAEEPGPPLLLFAWTASFGVLAILQGRFTADLSAPLCVATAMAIVWFSRAVGRGLRLPPILRACLGIALGGLLLAPALLMEHVPHASRWLLHQRGQLADDDPALRTASGSLVRFAERVRRLTPANEGFVEAETAPAYAVLADPSLGHVLHYVARRATPSDNFGPNIGIDNLHATVATLLATSEQQAITGIERMGVRYVLTSWQPSWQAGTLIERLHRRDGNGEGELPALGRFRLLAEGPEGGLTLGAALGIAAEKGAVPYKLFEVVDGAELRVHGEPRSHISLRARARTPDGRAFVFRSSGRTNAAGVASIRVPLASEPSPGVAVTWVVEPYRIVVGKQVERVHVSEGAVTEGGVVEVPRPAASD